MSRWSVNFRNHPFQGIWGRLKDTLDKTSVDDESVASNVEDLARLNKVIFFIDELLQAADPELMPLSIWSNFQQQSQNCLNELNHYNNNRNVQHIINANSHADNLLNYVRPYVVTPSNAARSAASSLSKYNKSINKYIEQNKVSLESLKKDIGSMRNEAESTLNEIHEFKRKIEQMDQEYFKGSDSTDSLRSRVEKLHKKLEAYTTEIEAYYEKLIDSGSESIKYVVDTATKDILEKKENVQSATSSIKEKLDELANFYRKIFGEKNKDGEHVGGLKDELGKRIAELDEFKEEQEIKYNAAVEQIESLLPGATSAGLSSAYHDLKVSFDEPIKKYTRLFYISILVMMATAFISIVDSVLTDAAFVKFVDISEIGQLLKNLAYKAPIILPVLWLAVFASKRRSEAQRLQQEYAHKEALAKSYQSFKQQIEELDSEEKEPLLHYLLESAIDAVAQNASSTLDGKHGDKLPHIESLEKMVDKIEKLKTTLLKTS